MPFIGEIEHQEEPLPSKKIDTVTIPALKPGEKYFDYDLVPPIDDECADPTLRFNPASGMFEIRATGCPPLLRHIPMWTSYDLINFEGPVETLPDKPDYLKNTWTGDEITYNNQRLQFLTAENGEFGTWLNRRNLDGSLIDTTCLDHGPWIFKIDGVPFVDPKTGRLLVALGSGGIHKDYPDIIGNLLIAELVEEHGKPKLVNYHSIIPPDPNHEYRSLNEGQWPIYAPETDYYYNFFSGRGYLGPYGISVARSRDPFGPYEIKKEMIFETGARFWWPGNNSVARTGYNQYLSAYHIIDSQKMYLPKTDHVRRVTNLGEMTISDDEWLLPTHNTPIQWTTKMALKHSTSIRDLYKNAKPGQLEPVLA